MGHPPHPAADRHVVVIGGGLSGLAAGYDLIRAGLRVTILEAAPDFGGLASSLQLEGNAVERFYHFVCRSDRHLIQLVDELGLSQRLHWRQTRTGFYYNGRHHSFGTPLDLLRFSPLPWSQRVRVGLHVTHSSYRSQWRSLDRIPAKPWLIKHIGEEAYNVIWHPLLKVKFGDDYDKISAAWIWHRIWRVAQSRRRLWERESFGCFEHGSATVVDALVERLRSHPRCELRTGTRVAPIDAPDGRVTEVRVGDERIGCDAVVSTVALPLLDRLVSGRSDPYFTLARSVKFIGVVCALLSLKRPFSSNFWTNINDPRISFNGIIEQTNLNQNLRDAGLNLIYVPFYLPTSHPRYQAGEEELFDEYVPMLKLINPEFDESWINERHVFRTPFAQAICVTDFASLMPDHRSPIRGLYITDSTQFYPEDRTISAAIEQGRKVARMILEDLT